MSKKRKKKMVCPTHGVKLVRVQTKYGGRWHCEVKGCDVRCWEGSTTTPADQKTCDARRLAHDEFDRHWIGRGNRRRNFAYTSLCRVLGISKDQCHIGYMNAEQAERVVMACQYGLVIDNIIERDERHAREAAEVAA